MELFRAIAWMQTKQASALVVVPTTVFASSGRKTNQIALGWCHQANTAQ